VAASNSLEAIASVCRDHIWTHFDVLLHVVELLVTLPIPTDTAVRVVKGVTKVCSRLPEQQISDALHRLCKIHIDELSRIAQVGLIRCTIIHTTFTTTVFLLFSPDGRRV